MAIKTPIQEDWRRSVGEVSRFEGSFKDFQEMCNEPSCRYIIGKLEKLKNCQKKETELKQQ